MVQHVQLGPGPGVELGDEHLKQLQVRSLVLSLLELNACETLMRLVSSGCLETLTTHVLPPPPPFSDA